MTMTGRHGSTGTPLRVQRAELVGEEGPFLHVPRTGERLISVVDPSL